MATGYRDSNYFSGQGVLSLAIRDAATGKPQGFTPVGNVSELSLGIEVSSTDHKESQTGVRSKDKTIITDLGATLNFTMESLDSDNLALALYGTSSAISAATDVSEDVVAFLDKWTPLSSLGVSNVVVTSKVTPATTYVEGTDYVLNADAGSIKGITGGTITDAEVLTVTYDAVAQSEVLGLMNGFAPERYARFEGLNTANTNKPVNVEVFRIATKPLAELALIGDDIAKMAVQSTGYPDAFRTTGSKYFRIRSAA